MLLSFASLTRTRLICLCLTHTSWMVHHHRYGSAAAAGNPQAQLQLGTLLAQGTGGPRDVPGAYELWSRAAAAGLVRAKRNLERANRCFVGVKFE